MVTASHTTPDTPGAAGKGLLAAGSLPKRAGLALFVFTLLVVLMMWAWWSQRAPKAVLFSDLAERDAAVFTAELDKLKQPYSLSEDGHAILVAADAVHRTRLALMGKPLPLHGAVGFELFNSADFGVSDFVQKVNYQRALQGELTRTVLSIEQVQDARIHLAIPEQALFRKDAQKAKASVTLSLKGGRSLQPEQVSGIQRLIGASVPEIKPEDVTVLDQHSVVLSRAATDEGAAAAGQLEARQGLEGLLARKVTRLLDQMFQPGETMVAVDVTLNLDQSRVTTEEVLGAATGEREGHPAGVITRERTTTREPATDSVTGTAGGSAQAQVQSQETDYQTGKRVTQTASMGGQVQRLHVAVVVRRPLSEAELAQVRQLVTTAVGIQPARGDTVAVQSMADMAAIAQAPASAAGLAPPTREPPLRPTPASDTTPHAEPEPRWVWLGMAGAAAVAVLAAVAVVMGRRRRMPLAESTAPLSAEEREAVLVNLRHWLEPQP